MERLNTKLYEKYRDLKKRKISGESERNSKVQAEFEKYLSVVEGMIEELQNENKRLRTQISTLEDRQVEYQQTLMEESRKAKELSDETERLGNLMPAEDHCNNEIGDMDIVSTTTPNRIRQAGSQDLGELMVASSNTRLDSLQHNIVDAIQRDNHEDEPPMTACCRINLSCSGDEKDNDCAKCVYQMLVESLVGMKFSVESRTNGFCLSVTHQSSGYSFSLTWTRKTDDEGELFYHVSSLGTIERVALEWMKEDLIFSTAMLRAFFERISRVIGRQS